MDAHERTPWWIPVVSALAVVAAIAWLSRPRADVPTATSPVADAGAVPDDPTVPAAARAPAPAATEHAPTPPPVEPDAVWDAPAELGPTAGIAGVVGARASMATAASVAADRAADRAMGRLERAVASLAGQTEWTPDVRLKVEAELDAVADALEASVAKVTERTEPLGVAVPNMDALTEQAAQRISDVVGEPITLDTLEPAPPEPGAGSWEGIPIDAWSAPAAR
jgi:hypothetical protein